MESFSYQSLRAPPSYADRATEVWRPMMKVAIFCVTKSIATTALVDTGASETLILGAYWHEIDPAFREGETAKIEAANGTDIIVKYTTVDMAIKLKGKTHRWSTLVGFTEDREEMILGDAGFLRYFAVTCDWANRTLTVRKTGKLPRSMLRPRL